MSDLESPLDRLKPVFLDVETTGLPAGQQDDDRRRRGGRRPGPAVTSEPEPLAITVLNNDGQVLLNTLVRPQHHTSWPGAQIVNGITPEQVFAPGVPTFAQVLPQLREVLRDRLLVCYNARFDCGFIGDALREPSDICCAMEEFAPFYGEWNEHHESYTWQSLERAARFVLHTWRGPAHSALADCFATRDVWEFSNWPAKREAVATERERRAQRSEERRMIQDFLGRQQAIVTAQQQQANQAWELANRHRTGARPAAQAAKESAAAFCEHLTGYPLVTWQAYGAQILAKPRYGHGIKKKCPPYLVRQDAGTYCFLRRTWRRADSYQLDALPGPVILPSAMQVLDSHGGALHLVPLFDLRKLTLGVDYVPYSDGKWPEGYGSATVLKREYKVKAKEVAQLRPAFMRVRHDYPDYLLYPLPARPAQPTLGEAEPVLRAAG